MTSHINRNEILEFYTKLGRMTDPGPYTGMLDNLPADLPGLVQVVQTNLIHVFWAERYGRPLDEAEKETLQFRSVRRKLERMKEVDPGPLSKPRPLEKRQVGNCRDFSVLLCALLQSQGKPARARCGFGSYFLPNHYEDHWVCETWNPDRGGWVLVDAQLDEFQQNALQIDFDPLDVPRDRFITAGKGFQMARKGLVDPDQFGIFDMHGLWFIQGDLMRDLLALNKVEILPWDGGWGYLTETGLAELDCFDRFAALTEGGDETFQALRKFYRSDPKLHVPQDLD